ncbi:MAG: PQQ-like beta-propeller repeat protein [Verrucomicrobia bacterium]|nr:PQQ-like beta-propeller repeat protein [Verrucomicrobiota bacterium]
MLRPLILSLLVPNLLILSRSKAEDWPRWRGPSANGISSETGWKAQWPPEGPRRVWSAKVGIGFSSFSVSAGRAFTMGNHNNQDSVFCFDAATGRQFWKHTYDCLLDPRYYDGGTSATPTVDGARVFSLSRKGHLFALNASDGTVIWQRNLAKELGAEIPEWGFAGSPLVDGDLLIVNVGDAATALEKDSGRTRWTNGKGPSGYSSATPFDRQGKHCVALATHAQIVGVEVLSGRRLWSHPWKTEYDINAADPVIQGDLVFVSSGYNHAGALLRLTDATATVVWENKLLRSQFSSPVLIDGNLYGVDGNAGPECALKCVEWTTGRLRWEKKGVGMASLMAAAGNLIVQLEKGQLLIVAASPAAYQEVSRAQVLGGKCWTQPVLANQRIYCRNSIGDVVCLDVAGR